MNLFQIKAKFNKMNVSKAITIMILVISFLMFIWQTSVAVGKLMNPPVVDSTVRLTMADIEPPLVTICHLEQWNNTKLQQYGYGDVIDLLQDFSYRSDAPTLVGWGAKHNLTFEELVDKVTDFHPRDIHPDVNVAKDDDEILEFTYELHFYPKYGYCFDISNFTAIGRIKIWISVYNITAYAFITDRKLRTRNNVFLESHFGSRIVMQEGFQEYIVKTELVSTFDPKNPDDCKEYKNDDYEKCIDDELQKVWKPYINCNPPWLSPKDQCASVMNITKNFTDSFKNKTMETVRGMYLSKTYPAKEKCIKACTVAQSNVFYGKQEVVNEKFKHRAALILHFADQVVYTTRTLAYGPPEFLIDMGSSLGLWFGLSVFGIKDLGFMAFKWLNAAKKSIN